MITHLIIAGPLFFIIILTIYFIYKYKFHNIIVFNEEIAAKNNNKISYENLDILNNKLAENNAITREAIYKTFNVKFDKYIENDTQFVMINFQLKHSDGMGHIYYDNKFNLLIKTNHTDGIRSYHKEILQIQKVSLKKLKQLDNELKKLSILN